MFVSAALINNYVLTQFLGMCPFFGVTKKVDAAAGMGISVLFVTTLSSVLTLVFYVYVLRPLGLEYLQTPAFILIIASIVQFVELYMKKSLGSLYSTLGIYLPMITVNCVILGVALINTRYVSDEHPFLEALANSVGAGAGFLLALVLLAAIREKYENHPDVPWIFQGFPLALFSAGLMSIAFMGFQGLI
ncbi:MAG: electron transport complex subunit RsxA [Oscillospiraceae bacterium]|jgi:electron transport complex protein RnfA|nr:electron transport complex subunit RsxA [Oscillospiraceae bacterium]